MFWCGGKQFFDKRPHFLAPVEMWEWERDWMDEHPYIFIVFPASVYIFILVFCERFFWNVEMWCERRASFYHWPVAVFPSSSTQTHSVYTHWLPLASTASPPSLTGGCWWWRGGAATATHSSGSTETLTAVLYVSCTVPCFITCI